MAFINEDRLEGRLMAQFKGRVVLIAAVAAVIGFMLGAVII